MEQLKGLVSLVQEAIENGATTVEDVHRSIASKPLDVLSNFEPIEGAVDRMRQIQDETIGNVYEMIRTINAQVGEIAKNMLDKVEK
jgi:hypothetical protein